MVGWLHEFCVYIDPHTGTTMYLESKAMASHQLSLLLIFVILSFVSSSLSSSVPADAYVLLDSTSSEAEPVDPNVPFDSSSSQPESVAPSVPDDSSSPNVPFDSSSSQPEHVATNVLASEPVGPNIQLDSSSSNPNRPEKVNLSLYYEALCPACKDFILNSLVNVFKTDLHSIVNLRLIPWGNAEVYNGTISCQYGKDECTLNEFEACVIHTWPQVDKHYPPIQCIESIDFKENIDELHVCFNKNGLPEKPVVDCYKSGLGRKLALQYGEETRHLNPPLQFVPWVVVDNKPLKLDYMKYITYVCKAYKGRRVPKACKRPPLGIYVSPEAANLCNASAYGEQVLHGPAALIN